MKYSSLEEFVAYVAEHNPGQPEYLQAVTEVMESLWPFISTHPRYAEHGLLDRLVEPERIIMFPSPGWMTAARSGSTAVTGSSTVPPSVPTRAACVFTPR